MIVGRRSEEALVEVIAVVVVAPGQNNGNVRNTLTTPGHCQLGRPIERAPMADFARSAWHRFHELFTMVCRDPQPLCTSLEFAMPAVREPLRQTPGDVEHLELSRRA